MVKPNIEQELKSLISSKLKQIRIERGDSIEKLAETLSLDYSVFYHIYSGAHLPRLTTLWQISNILNIPIADWFSNLDFKNKATVNGNSLEFTILHNFKKFDKPTKKLFAKIFQKLNTKERKYSKEN